PVFPLDGGQIARSFLSMTDPRNGVKQSLQLSILTGAALAVTAGIWTGSPFLTIMFGFLAYQSYVALQYHSSGGGFGGRRGGGGFGGDDYGGYGDR
ncbi:MAG: hypothetical protein N2C14_31545, partial [Planctomycetales bacterium]